MTRRSPSFDNRFKRRMTKPNKIKFMISQNRVAESGGSPASGTTGSIDMRVSGAKPTTGKSIPAWSFCRAIHIQSYTRSRGKP